MKSYNEMAQNALKRIDEENKAKAKRNKRLKRTLIPTLSLCLAAVIGISVMGGFGIKVAPEIEIEESLEYQYEGAIDTNGNTAGKLTGNKGEVAVGGSAKPDNSNGSPAPQSSAPQDAGDVTDDPCIRVVDIIYNGKTYIQIECSDMSEYEKENHIGSTTDFNGYYKDKKTKGKVFTVKDNFELLIIELDGGQMILLKEVD